MGVEFIGFFQIALLLYVRCLGFFPLPTTENMCYTTLIYFKHCFKIMKFNEVNDSISFTITINVVIATAINYFMDKSIFTGEFANALAELYGVSIIVLIFCYVFLQLIHPYLENYFKNIHTSLIINLFISNLLLLFTSYPPIYFKYGFTLIKIFITLNIAIPITLFIVLYSIMVGVIATELRGLYKMRKKSKSIQDSCKRVGL